MPTFGQLRTQARSLETETETLLSRYAGFAQSLSASVMEDENRVVKNIEENLQKVFILFFLCTMLIY
jgi:Golgi SNAP receptor complex protein 1